MTPNAPAAPTVTIAPLRELPPIASDGTAKRLGAALITTPEGKTLKLEICLSQAGIELRLTEEIQSVIQMLGGRRNLMNARLFRVTFAELAANVTALIEAEEGIEKQAVAAHSATCAAPVFIGRQAERCGLTEVKLRCCSCSEVVTVELDARERLMAVGGLL